MNREDIIRMAQEAGIIGGTFLSVDALTRFAALVEAHVLAGLREKYTWGTPLLDAALLAPEPGQLKDKGAK